MQRILMMIAPIPKGWIAGDCQLSQIELNYPQQTEWVQINLFIGGRWVKKIKLHGTILGVDDQP